MEFPLSRPPLGVATAQVKRQSPSWPFQTDSFLQPRGITYAAKGGTVVRKSQFECESYGGVFLIGTAPVLWTCVGWPNNGVADFQGKFNQLAADCSADALSAGHQTASTSAINYTVPGLGDVVCEGLG